MTLEDFKEGQIILIDKPLNWTSFQVVNKIRWTICKQFGIKKIKVGHAGTLDPLASGLLILCTGKMTKQIESLQAQTKTYTGLIQLGSTTPSYDLETEIDETYPTDHIDENSVEEVTKQFKGDILQKPPLFSAIKKDGKRLYKHARKGQKIEVEARPVQIHKFESKLNDDMTVEFLIECGKGTYIRSIAHDFGQALNSGGHLIELRRTAIGDHNVDDAWSIESWVEQLKSV